MVTNQNLENSRKQTQKDHKGEKGNCTLLSLVKEEDLGSESVKPSYTVNASNGNNNSN